jgi:hypothetical protein
MALTIGPFSIGENINAPLLARKPPSEILTDFLPQKQSLAFPKIISRVASRSPAQSYKRGAAGIREN